MSHGSGAPRPGNRFRVLQVTPAYAPSVGGVETCVREVSQRLVAQNTDVLVLTADASHKLTADDQVDGIRVKRVRAWPRDQDYGIAPGIYTSVARSLADVVHVQCYQTFVAPLAMAAAARVGIPFVLTFHGGGHSSRLRRRIRTRQLKTLRPLLRRAAALIATAEWEINEYSEMLNLERDRFVLIPNGGDLPGPATNAVQRSGTLIVSIGRAERYKGHHRVLEAFPHVLREFEDARLWIAGEGPFVPELRKLAEELGVEHRVEIRAIRDREEYTRRLAGASVATLLSDFETHPMAALEAIKLGIPTLVADNSGLGELARKGHADAISLRAGSRSHADAIISLIHNPPAAREIEICSWDDCTTSLQALYARVSGRVVPADEVAPLAAVADVPEADVPAVHPSRDEVAPLAAVADVPEADVPAVHPSRDEVAALAAVADVPAVHASRDEVAALAAVADVPAVHPSRDEVAERVNGHGPVALARRPVAKATSPAKDDPGLELPPTSAQARGPVLAVLAGALGLAIVGVSFYLSRSGNSRAAADVCFWVGFLVMLGPSVARSTAADTPRSHRVFLAVFVGLLVYAVKVIYSPQTYVLADELFHLSVAQDVASNHALFAPVSIQGANVASDYPGLESITVGMHNVSGLSLFTSGLAVIGVARIIMMLALFRFAELVTRSSRVAGLAPLIYAASGNFLFFSAQFSYESLALPLFVVAVGIIIARGMATSRRPHDIALLMVAAALIATHHLTAYSLAILLWIVTGLAMRRAWRPYRAIGVAVLITAGAAAWFVFVAPETQSYLSYIVDRTVTSVQQVVSSGGTHLPFQSNSGGGGGGGGGPATLQTPLPEQIISYLSVLILAIGVISALLRYRRFGIRVSPGPLIAAGAALGFLGLYPLRVAPGAWETANRGQEFFFFGAATALALASVQFLRGAPAGRARVAALTAVVLLVVCGGVIEGWPAPLRLPLPLQVKADDHTIVPQSLEASTWALSHLGHDNVFVGDEITGRELAVGGARFTYMGSSTGVPQALEDPTFQPWVLRFLRRDRVGYVVVDRRALSGDNLEGYFFQPASSPDGGKGYIPLAASRKFSRLPMVSAVFDSGDIRIYDVRSLWNTAPPCRSVNLTVPDPLSCLTADSLVSKAGPDRVVAFPTYKVRYIATDVMPGAARTLTVSVRVQMQNLGQGGLPVGFGGQVSFTAGSVRLHRVQVPARHDNLTGRRVIPGGGSVEGSVSFRVRSRADVAAVRRHGVTVSIRSDGRVSDTQTGGTPRFQVARFPVSGLPRKLR